MTGAVQRSGARFGALSAVIGRVQERVREAIVPLDEVVRALPADQRVIEIGCGEGLVINRILANCAHVVGVDIDGRKISRARSRFADATNLSLYLEDALSFLARTPDGSFTAAVLVDTLSSFTPVQQKQVLTEALRVLAEDGTLLVKAIDGSVPLKSEFSMLLSGLIYRGLKLSLSEGQKFTYLSASAIADCLKAAGAKVEIRHLHDERFHPIPHVLIIARKKRRSHP